MKPVIKWPGGKGEEIGRIAPLVPEFSRYSEPFLGGGAVFFHLEPARARVVDVNADLIGLYRAISDDRAALTARLEALCDAWDRIGEIGARAGARVRASFGELRRGGERDDAADLAARALEAEREQIDDLEGTLGLAAGEGLRAICAKTLSAKLWRIHNAERRAEAPWADDDLAAQAETAVRAGLYTWIRDSVRPQTPIERALRFFFIREFCYGAMFRLNRQGHFNIPYGGRSYNAKNLRAKVAYLVSEPVAELMRRTEILEGDFGQIFSEDLTRSDFVFCDPPYDSEFSDYDGHAFGRAEQRRLAEAFAATDAKCLLVVQRTPFIADLYAQVARDARHPVVIDEYGKNYAYNVKGRNEQAAKHLAIRNYAV